MGGRPHAGFHNIKQEHHSFDEIIEIFVAHVISYQASFNSSNSDFTASWCQFSPCSAQMAPFAKVMHFLPFVLFCISFQGNFIKYEMVSFSN